MKNMYTTWLDGYHNYKVNLRWNNSTTRFDAVPIEVHAERLNTYKYYNKTNDVKSTSSSCSFFWFQLVLHLLFLHYIPFLVPVLPLIHIVITSWGDFHLKPITHTEYIIFNYKVVLLTKTFFFLVVIFWRYLEAKVQW